jgi:tRNA pseudouridine55 synthase
MAPTGILLIDKAEGWTSHDVVARTRRAVSTRKVGHAGTLDPMATGLLVLGVGSSTRLLTYLVGLPKVYTATIRLGLETLTDDREGEVTMVCEPGQLEALADERIRDKISLFTGDIMQAPSAVSAIKVDGRRAYDRVRAGEHVELKPRAVNVAEFELLQIRRGVAGSAERPFIDLDVRVNCSSGTYIRALARDLGRELAVGGHLTELRRESVGPFQVSDAVDVERIDPATNLLDPATVAKELFAPLNLDEQQTVDLQHGKKLLVDEADAEAVAAIAPDGRLIGLVSVKAGKTKVLVNFPTEDARD